MFRQIEQPALLLAVAAGGHPAVVSVTGTTDSNHALPDSLDLSRWCAFVAANPWQWLDSFGATQLNTLPAKARREDGMPDP
jgi:hypothetical protein